MHLAERIVWLRLQLEDDDGSGTGTREEKTRRFIVREARDAIYKVNILVLLMQTAMNQKRNFLCIDTQY